MNKFDNVQQEINNSQNRERLNKVKRQTQSYKNRTTVAIPKKTKPLLNDLADENRLSAFEMLDKIVRQYKKDYHENRYDKFLKKRELKGQ
jgi:diadenosine tetraphosphate (Ap4A) HIT family hydrolase